MAAAARTSPGTSNNPHILPKPPLSFAAIVSGKGDPASPRAASKSFSSIFENGGSLPIKSPGTYKGEPALFFSKEEVETLSAPFRFTLIGKFSYGRPSMEVIRKFFSSLGLKSLKSVGLIHENHVVIFISDQDDYSRLLLRSTWYVNGAPMKISNWSPDFLPFYDSPIVPVWIGFPGLPLHFFEKSVLFSLASVFGSPLKTDEPTALFTRPSVARVCVDLDVSKPRRNRIWLGDEKVGFWQEVVYENPPLFCCFCQKLGHEEDNCFVKNPEIKKDKNPPTRILEKKKNQPLNNIDVNEPLTWQKKSTPSNPELQSVGVKSSKVVMTVNTEEEEGVWLIQKSKKNRKNINIVHKNQTPVLKENSSLGVALTPLNPLFLAKMSKSQGFQTTQHGIPSLESSSKVNSQSKENTSGFSPAQVLEKEIDTHVALSRSQPLPTSQPLNLGVPSPQQLPLSVPLGSTKAAEQPSLHSVSDKSGETILCKNQSEPDISLYSKGPDSVKLGIQCLGATSCMQSASQFHETKVLHAPSCISRMENLEPLISGGKKLIQPLMSGNDVDVREFQPSLIACGDLLVPCSENFTYEPNSSSLPCASGVHVLDNQPSIDPNLQTLPSNCLELKNGIKLQPPPLTPSFNDGAQDINCVTNILGHQSHPSYSSLPCASGDHGLNNHPLIVHKLQHQPINCLALENENSFQPPIISRGVEVETCDFNMAPSILEEFGPDSSQELSISSGPVLVEDILGPNAIIIVNPQGQVDHKNEGFNRSPNFLAHGSKVTLPFNINHIQSLLLSFLADHGVVVRPPLHKALVEFSTILENSFDDSWEISWPFFQENLFRFFRSSEVTIPKKTRRILKFFFQVAEEKNWPFSNTKGKMPVVEDSSSHTDESS